MATPIPFEGKITLPVEWSGKVNKITMRAGASSMSTTLGFNPSVETATLTWRLPSVADAKTLLDTLGPHFNGTYTYQCPIRGEIKIKPSDNYAFREYRVGKSVSISISFERVA